MEIEAFGGDDFRGNKTLKDIGTKYSAGQVTIIGGSKLFHGAPVLALKAASRMVSMTFFSTPEEDKEFVDKLKSALSSFVWIPRQEIDSYVEKSDAVLIGPGLMRSHISKSGFVCDDEGMQTRMMTVNLLKKYPDRKWIIDGGSLQVVTLDDLPSGVAVTPNDKEFEMLFGEAIKKDVNDRCEQVFRLAKKYKIVILTKGEVSVVSDGSRVIRIEGGNEGLVKGGVGDVIAGLALGFLAKNEKLFSLAAATFLVKKTAEKLALSKGLMFNADDLVDAVPEVFADLTMRE